MKIKKKAIGQINSEDVDKKIKTLRQNMSWQKITRQKNVATKNVATPNMAT
jgi:hypothetical protein